MKKYLKMYIYIWIYTWCSHCRVHPVLIGNALFTKCSRDRFSVFKVVNIDIMNICSPLYKVNINKCKFRIWKLNSVLGLSLVCALLIPDTVVPTCCCGYPSQRDVWRWSGTPRRRSPGSSWPDWCLRERREAVITSNPDCLTHCWGWKHLNWAPY